MNVIYLFDPSMDLAIAIGDFGGVEVDHNITLNDFCVLMHAIDDEYKGDLATAIADIKSGTATFVQIPDPYGEIWTLVRQPAS
jgi:hypothetical protein